MREYNPELMHIMLNKISNLEIGMDPEVLVPLIKDIIRKGTNRKCPDLESIGVYDPSVNMIPSKDHGVCKPRLIVGCLDRDSLDNRLREMVYHAGIYCVKENKNVLFITSKWEGKIFDKHRIAIEALKTSGIRFNFLLFGRDSVIEI